MKTKKKTRTVRSDLGLVAVSLPSRPGASFRHPPRLLFFACARIRRGGTPSLRAASLGVVAHPKSSKIVFSCVMVEKKGSGKKILSVIGNGAGEKNNKPEGARV